MDSWHRCNKSYDIYPDLLCETQLLPSTEFNKVHLPNGQQIPIVFSGKSRLTQGDISHVLYIPDFKYNLLSVSKLTRELHCCMVFYPDHCILQDLHTGKVKGTGSMENGLYYWSHSVSSTVASTISPSAALSTMDTVDLWQTQLGHIPHKVLQQMQIPHISNSSKLSPCTVCPLAKQTRLPFPQSSTRSNNVFDLIHADVWGPYKFPTYDGNRYFLLW